MDFYRALGSGAADRACAALAPEARSSLEEQEEERCADVILDQDLPRVSGGPKVEVYGSMAQARFAGETAFLSRFDDGWRLTAVGCAPTVGDVPHRCRIEVG